MKFPKRPPQPDAPAPTPSPTVDIPALPHEVAAATPAVHVSAGPSDEILRWAAGPSKPNSAVGGMLSNLFPRSFGRQ
jgi:hypothetical protein